MDPTKFGFLLSPIYALHSIMDEHPENADRLNAIKKAFETHKLKNLLSLTAPKPANIEDIALVHKQAYIEAFKNKCHNGSIYFHSYDNYICNKSYEVANMAVGGILNQLDMIMKNELMAGFCATRPPGHHAEMNKAMGFCFFNNVAIAAKYLQARHEIEKILIIDFDVHHGNGTQFIFEEDPAVFYLSIHEHPSFLFPGTGRKNEIGIGKGKGYTLNIPLPPSSGDDRAIPLFEQAMERISTVFKADFVLVSAGFDAYMRDPLAHLNLTEISYENFGRLIAAYAKAFSKSRVVSVLEGGYYLPDLGNLCMHYMDTLINNL